MFARRVAALATVLAVATAVATAAVPARRAAPTPAAHPAAPARAAARPAHAAPEQVLDAVAAMVNNEAVYTTEVDDELGRFLQQLQQQGDRGMPDSAQIDTLRHQILARLIDNRLLLGEAKRQAIVVADAEVDRQVDAEIARAKESVGGEAKFQEALRQQHQTESALRAEYQTEIRKLMMVERLKMKQFPKHAVPQAEAEAYFRAHPDRFPKIPSQVRVQVIEIAPQPDSAAMATGLARIEAIRKRLIGGEKFAKVAADASEDPRSASAGGDIGFVELNHPVKDFQAFNDAALTLKLNEISPPVRTPYGWHLIQVIERDTLKTVAGRDSLDDAGKPIPEAHVRHILVALKTTDADAQRASALAAHVRDEARKGTDFAALVRRYSSYAGPAGPDGDLGFIPSTQLPGDMRAGLDTLEANQVSEVFASPASFTLFKLLDRKPERAYTLDDFHGKLADFVGDLQREDRFDAWMKTLRAKAQIEYH